MSAKSNSPRQQAATPLRWLLWAEIAEACIWPVTTALFPLLMRLREEISLRRAFEIGLPLYLLAPQVITAFGLLRFMAPMDEGGTRRWARATLILLGLETAHMLGVARYGPALFAGLGALEPVAEVGGLLVFKACTAALLMTVWRGCQQLAASAPRGLFILAVALMGAGLLLGITESLRRAYGLFVPVLTQEWTFVATQSLAIGSSMLILGGLAQARATLLRTQDMAAVGPDWEKAARGLTLYLCSMGVSAAAFLIAVLLRRVGWEWYALPIFILVLFTAIAVMSAGLLLYARMPEASRARGPVYLALILVAPWHMASFFVHEGSMAAAGLLPLALAGQALLIESLRRVATALDEHDLAGTARGLRFWLPVSSGVLLALQYQTSLRNNLGLYVFLVGVATLISWVIFLQLATRLKAAMRAAAMPQQSLGMLLP